MNMGREAGGEGSRRIEAIQMLRAVTATLVVLTHTWIFTAGLARRMGIAMPPPGITGGGRMDMFFIISGFIMIYSSKKLFGRPGARALFWKRRLIRVGPLYCLATITFAWWLWRVGKPADPALVAASLAFLPYNSAGDTGYVVPLIDAGWTLNYEILFYLVLGASLSLNAGRTVAIAAGALAGLVLIGPLVADWGVAPFAWTRPILLQYVAGMGVALLVARGVQLPSRLRAVMIIFGTALFLCQLTAHFPHWQGWERTLSGGIPALLVFSGCVLGPMKLPLGRVWEVLGDISYSLYVWHMPILVVLMHLYTRVGLPYSAFGYAIGALVVVYAASAASYYVFERPVTRYLNARFTPRVASDERLEISGV